MAVTAEDYQALILDELDAPDEDAVVLNAQIPVIWDSWESKSRVSIRLRYLYAKRQAIDLLIGRHWQDVTTQDAGTNTNDSDLVKNLQTLRTDVQSDIAEEERQYAGGRSPRIGAITQTAPVTTTSGYDPNHRCYRGDSIERS